MDAVFEFLDPYFIWFYRLSGYTFADFLFGTFVLGFMAVIIGELTISVAFLFSRRRIDRVNEEVVRYQNLSQDAFTVGDKATYKAANKLANDAFGKSFFMQFGFSAAFLWPVFFVLQWMQTRFGEVEFPFLSLDYTVGYACIFIPLYVAAYLGFKRIKGRLPYFRHIRAVLQSYERPASAAEDGFAEPVPRPHAADAGVQSAK